MFKKFLLIVLIGIALLLITSFLFFQNQSTEISTKHQMAWIEKRLVYINGRPLSVEIADEPYEQARGLSGRDFLGENDGMLFIFSQPGKHGFWMKNMKFPLDIIWIDENLTIVDITKNLSPATYPATFAPSSPVKYVLEINTGWSDKNSVRLGDIVSF